MTKKEVTDPNKSAIIGFSFSLPFIILNFIVSLRIEPIYSFLGSFPVVRNNPFVPLFLLLLFPIGAFVAIRPMFQKSKNEKLKKYFFNIVVATLLLIVFLPIFTALSEELYRCNMLNVPNCD